APARSTAPRTLRSPRRRARTSCRATAASRAAGSTAPPRSTTPAPTAAPRGGPRPPAPPPRPSPGTRLCRRRAAAGSARPRAPRRAPRGRAPPAPPGGRRAPPQRGDRGEEQLHAAGAADRVRGRDQQREAHAVRLVQPPVGGTPVRPELVRIELGVGAMPVLVADVDVAVVDDRVRREQVVRLVASVVGAGERVEPDRGGVDAEEQQPEGEGATHWRRTLATDA